MRITHLLLVFGLVAIMAAVLPSISCNGDDDDDDDNAPDVPHDFNSGTNCLASGCHEGKHGGMYDGDPIPGKCLECHGGTPSDDDDSDDDDDNDSGDDDDDDNDTGHANGPDIPHSFNDGTNCLSIFCHRGQHDGQYNNDPIPGKCFECHQGEG